MIVAETDIDKAVLDLFLDYNVPADGQLPYETLKAEWPKYLLRTSDLDAAVRRLVNRGELCISDEQPLTVVLTQQGFKRCRSRGKSAAAGKSLWTRLRDTLWLEFRPILNAKDQPHAERRTGGR